MKKSIEVRNSGKCPKFQTKKGEYVRSKSEKILADCFTIMGYYTNMSAHLQLVSGRVIFPILLYNIEDEKETIGNMTE